MGAYLKSGIFVMFITISCFYADINCFLLRSNFVQNLLLMLEKMRFELFALKNGTVFNLTIC